MKTIHDPLPDGLYADVGAEHFTNPGYDHYRRYVEKSDLPLLTWARRQNTYRHIDGPMFHRGAAQGSPLGTGCGDPLCEPGGPADSCVVIIRR